MKASTTRAGLRTLDLNTMWFGGGAVINTLRNPRIMAERMDAAGVKLWIEVFDGSVASLREPS